MGSALAPQDAPLRETLTRDEDTPRMRHYQDPRDPQRAWCGWRSSKPQGFNWHKPRVGAECVVCADLYRTFGLAGWLAEYYGAGA